MQDIPHDVLEHRDRVRVLDLTNNRFSELPASIDLVMNLEKLTVSQNAVAAIHCQLSLLQRLKVRTSDCILS